MIHEFIFSVIKYAPIEGNCYNIESQKFIKIKRASMTTAKNYLHKLYPSRENYYIEPYK